ncbi:MAG: hypothetical protein ACPG48_03660, partial [Candidatus Puniceispirillaceae bacterium]
LGTTAADDSALGAILVPADAAVIDEKLDDGVANTGEVYAVDGSGITAGDCSAAGCPDNQHSQSIAAPQLPEPWP